MSRQNDLSMTSGSSPTSTTKTSKPAVRAAGFTVSSTADASDGAVETVQETINMAHRNEFEASGSSPTWFNVDKEGLRKTLARKSKEFVVYELLQNGFDAGSTEVTASLTEPDSKGKSVLECIDDAPGGYADLSHSHTMFAESAKKSDPKLRGRFNVGDKMVLALCDRATITSTTGRVMFQPNGTRRHDTKIKTKMGSKFEGELQLTPAEYTDIKKRVSLVIPPVPTTFNGKQIPMRKPLHEFKVTLPTEIADGTGVSKLRPRTTQVRLYEVPDGEAYLYEMGMPVVQIDCKWSVDVQQKVPLNIERDNVSPAYLKAILGAIINEKGDDISEEDAAAGWLSMAMESKNAKPEAVKKVFQKKHGVDAVFHDSNDPGASKEATAAGKQVVNPRAVPKAVRKVLMEAGIKKASADFSTDPGKTKGIIPDNKLTPAMRRYKLFIERVTPLVVDHKLKKVVFANDPKSKIYGCTKWNPKDFIFTVNVAGHNVENWQDNYDLFIHEIGHFYARGNDHLNEDFYHACTLIGARMAGAALRKPELFPVFPINLDKHYAQ
jgi:hypothetical protein